MKRKHKQQSDEVAPGDMADAPNQGPDHDMMELLKSLQKLNRALIFENDRLKAENIELTQLAEVQDQRIKLLTKAVGDFPQLAQNIGKKISDKFQDATLAMVSTTLPILVKSQVSEKAKSARKARTQNGSAKVREKALELFDGHGGGIAAAARAIFFEVQTFANTLTPRQSLSKSRFEKTLGDWLKQRNKTPPTR